MTNGLKRYRHTAGKVALRRIWANIEKCLVGILFFSACVALAYILFAYIVLCLEEGKVFNPVSEWRCLGRWYNRCGNHDTSGYIPTIFVASISLLLAVLTLGQSHYGRIQDRAMAFPKNHIEMVSIGLDIISNIRLTRKYFDPVVSSALIEFRFKEGFSTYYKAYPFRLFVCLKNIASVEDDEWEKLAIYNFRHSNLSSERDTYEMLVEGSDSRLLRKYCNISNRNADYRLKIVFDIRWTNKLMPLWCRIFNDIYIRQEMEIDWTKEPQGKMMFPNCYKVLYMEHSKAQIASWINEKKCRKTLRRQMKEGKRAIKNQNMLEERIKPKVSKGRNRSKANRK